MPGARGSAPPWGHAAGRPPRTTARPRGPAAAPGADRAEQVRERVGGEGRLAPAPYLAAVRRTAAAQPAPLFKHLRQEARTWAVAARGRAEPGRAEPSRPGGTVGAAAAAAAAAAAPPPPVPSAPPGGGRLGRPASPLRRPAPPRSAALRPGRFPPYRGRQGGGGPVAPCPPTRSASGRSAGGRLRVGALPAALAGEEEEEEVRGDAIVSHAASRR